MSLPRVFFDVAADGAALGRIVVEVCCTLFVLMSYQIARPARRDIENETTLCCVLDADDLLFCVVIFTYSFINHEYSKVSVCCNICSLCMRRVGKSIYRCMSYN